MAKIQIIRYQCDVCKSEFEKEKDLESTHIPCYTGADNTGHAECKVDLCKKCAKNLREIIYKSFAQIQDYYGIHIINKQKKE